jgi:hypothetical protein
MAISALFLGMQFLAVDGAQAADQTARIYCNLKALSPAEREAHQKLSQELLAAVRETRELDEGFALSLDTHKATIPMLAQWVDAERKCCPFLRFEIDKEPAAGPLWLRLSGPAGTKDFLRSELALGDSKAPTGR